MRINILLANAVIHFDNALYSYLTPVLAPLFFPSQVWIVQIILGYSVLATAWLTKPCGVFLFSKFVQTKGVSASLAYTLLGISFALLAIGILPTYKSGALWSTLGLVILRMGMEMFSAGENIIARLYLIESVDDGALAKKVSLWYEISSMVGLIFASCTGVWFACLDSRLVYWRSPFVWSGALTLFIFLLFRSTAISTNQPPISPAGRWKYGILFQFWKERFAMIRMSIVVGFSYITYVVPFVLMNSLVPMITSISYATMMQHNMALMVLDLFLLIILSRLLPKFSYNCTNIMGTCAALMALSIVPLFLGLSGASIYYIAMMRCWITALGVVFCSVLTLWCKRQIGTSNPYLTIGFASVLGSALLGKTAPMIFLTLFYKFNSLVWPACYLSIIALMAMVVMANSPSD